MDKLQKYNQRLLAIIGTLALAALAVFIFIMGILLVIELVDDFGRDSIHDNALVVTNDSTQTKDVEEFIRKQELTLGTPRLIDTLDAIYLIPVSQVNLKDPEYTKVEKVQGLLESSSRKRYWSYSGYFNNIILYNRLAETKIPVFDEKVLLTQFEHREIDNRLYLLIRGVTTDANQNGKLDGDDLGSFYLYDIDSDSLRKIALEGHGLDGYYVPYQSTEILLRFTKDKDSDGEIDEFREPTIIKKLDLKTGLVNDLIEDEMRQQLQQLID